MTTANVYATGLLAAADLLRREAKKHHEALAEIEAEDPHCEEARMHAIEIESLLRMAERILALPNPYGAVTPEPEIKF